MTGDFWRFELFGLVESELLSSLSTWNTKNWSASMWPVVWVHRLLWCEPCATSSAFGASRSLVEMNRNLSLQINTTSLLWSCNVHSKQRILEEIKFKVLNSDVEAPIFFFFCSWWEEGITIITPVYLLPFVPYFLHSIRNKALKWRALLNSKTLII